MVTMAISATQGYSLANIPLTHCEIVDEIVGVTSLPRSVVERRVRMEALEGGWNVTRDAERFGVTPHEMSPQMENLYRESDSFVFETLVFWSIPFRRAWAFHALDRIRLHASALGVALSDLRVLMLGDGAGNDTLFLAQNGLHTDYFDVPGSRTYEFAVRRFSRLGLLGDRIGVVPSYEECLLGNYDVVVSFEVLEHLPDPPRAIRDIAGMLREGGIALITEAFAHFQPKLPTHLRSNLRFAGKTPFLFLSRGLKLEWYSRDRLFHPMQFRRVGGWHARDYLSLWRDRNVSSDWCLYRLSGIKRTLRGFFGRW